MIAAMDRDGVIGAEGRIPWRIPGEQRHFKNMTMGKAVIMGRKTYESIGKPLAGRATIVVTRDPNVRFPGAEIARSPQEALELARRHASPEIFIAGGADIYRAFMPLADRLVLTRIDHSLGGDTFFPPFDRDAFRLVSAQRFDGEIPYAIEIYERAPPMRPQEGSN